MAVLFGIIIVDLVGFGIVMPILPYYAVSFDASPTTLGLLLAAYPAFQFLFAPVWGRVSDRLGRRPVMLVTIAGTAAALTALGLADSLAGLFAARVLGGVFGANISVATAYISDVTSESERTRWMGLVGASFGIGFVLGPALGGALAPTLDGSWPAAVVFGDAVAARLAPLGYGIPVLAAAVLAAGNWVWACARLREPECLAPREAAAGATRLEVLRDPVVRRLCATNLAFALAVTQLESMFQLFMIDRFHYDAIRVAAILVGMAVVMGAIQGGAMRRLAARFGERRLALWGLALLALSIGAVPFMGSVPLTLVPLAVSAVGRGIGQPPLMSLASLAADPGRRGSVMGTFQSSASLARVVGPAVAGALYHAWSASPFLLASALMGVAFVAALGLPAGASPSSREAAPDSGAALSGPGSP